MVGLVIVLLPTVSAGAESETRVKGSNPTSAMCRTLHPKGEKSPVGGSPPQLSTHHSFKAQRAMAITDHSKEIKDYQLLLRRSSGAPSIVKKEIPAAISFLQEMKSQYLRYRTASQFKSAKTPKGFETGFDASYKVGLFIFDQCGGVSISEKATIGTGTITQSPQQG
jgi:hypothetical protein